MKNIYDVVKNFVGENTEVKPTSEKDLLINETTRFNSRKMHNPYFHCEKCNDKRIIAYPNFEINRVCYKQCDCDNKYRVCAQLNRLGLYEFSKKATFDNYVTNEQWQLRSKETARKYVDNYQNKWFFIGGAVGCGKTHLCTAIVLGILEKQPEISIQYVKWDDSVKDLIEDDPYGEKTKELKNSDVLYLDDFLRGKDPKNGEIRKAKEILDYRYMRKKATIISSELNLDEIIKIDEAIGSRIMEMSHTSKVVYIKSSKSERNVRMNPQLIERKAK